MKKPFNTLKLQQDILKINEKGNNMKPGTAGGHPAIILEDSTAMYIFPDGFCKLNMQLLRNCPVTFDSLVEGFERVATNDLEVTGRIYYLNETLVKFNDDIYVNAKLLEHYIDIEDSTISFKGSAHNAPVLVYYYDQLIAVMMPTNIKKVK